MTCLNQARRAQQRNLGGGKEENLPESGKACPTKRLGRRESGQPALVRQGALNKGIQEEAKGTTFLNEIEAINEGIRGEEKGTNCLNPARGAQQRDPVGRKGTTYLNQATRAQLRGPRGGKTDNLPESGKARSTKGSAGRERGQHA